MHNIASSNEAGAQPRLFFGLNIDPGVDGLEEALYRARRADRSDLDVIALQDHPYNPGLFDTWTLLSVLAAQTERVHLATNVLNTPLHPPAMLAKSAATLDVISGGRLELGLGAGGYVDGMRAWGASVGSTPGERYQAFKEYVDVVRGLWAHSDEPFDYEGQFHQVRGAASGPAPAHPIGLWFGANGPRMLRLAGQEADGWVIGSVYILPEGLVEVNRQLDAGAVRAGRDPASVHRGYNLMGMIDLGGAGRRIRFNRPGVITGTPEEWVETLLGLHRDYRHDTFVFWPVAGDAHAQIEVFIEQIMPAVRQGILEMEKGSSRA